jgi:hypothetical protein
MAVNKPIGDNARKGAVKKNSQLQTKIMGKKTWTKTSEAGARRPGQLIVADFRPKNQGF